MKANLTLQIFHALKARKLTQGKGREDPRYSAADDPRDEPAAGTRAVDEREDAVSDVVTAVHVRGGLDRVGVGGPHIGTGDLVPVAMDDPPKGREARLDGKRRVLLGEVASSPRQRLGIARRPIRESHRLVEEPGVLRRREPLALIARRELHEIQQHTAPWFVGVLLRHRSKPPEIGVSPVRRQGVAGIGCRGEFLSSPRAGSRSS